MANDNSSGKKKLPLGYVALWVLSVAFGIVVVLLGQPALVLVSVFAIVASLVGYSLRDTDATTPGRAEVQAAKLDSHENARQEKEAAEKKAREEAERKAKAEQAARDAQAKAVAEKALKAQAEKEAEEKTKKAAADKAAADKAAADKAAADKAAADKAAEEVARVAAAEAARVAQAKAERVARLKAEAERMAQIAEQQENEAANAADALQAEEEDEEIEELAEEDRIALKRLHEKYAGKEEAFLEFVVSLYEKNGYVPTSLNKKQSYALLDSPQGGPTVILRAKPYAERYRAGQNRIRTLAEDRKQTKSQMAVFVATSLFGRVATEKSKARKIDLVDGRALLTMIRELED